MMNEAQKKRMTEVSDIMVAALQEVENFFDDMGATKENSVGTVNVVHTVMDYVRYGAKSPTIEDFNNLKSLCRGE